MLDHPDVAIASQDAFVARLRKIALAVDPHAIVYAGRNPLTICVPHADVREDIKSAMICVTTKFQMQMRDALTPHLEGYVLVFE